MTTGGSVMLVGVGKDDGDTVTVVGSPDSVPTALLGEIWDAVKGLGGKLVDLIQGCKPIQTTQVNVDKDGKITGVTVTNACTPN
jgi:hypothetical protein